VLHHILFLLRFDIEKKTLNFKVKYSHFLIQSKYSHEAQVRVALRSPVPSHCFESASERVRAWLRR